MTIQARCPGCAAVIRAGDKYAGQRVKCPKCGGTISVPTATEAKPASRPAGADASPPAAEPAVAAVSAPRSGEPPPAAPTIGGLEPFVEIDDFSQRWQHVVSRSGRARRRAPRWLGPAAAGVACALSVAVIVFVFTRSDEDGGNRPEEGNRSIAQRQPEETPDEPGTDGSPETDASVADVESPDSAGEQPGIAPQHRAAEPSSASTGAPLAGRENGDGFPQESLGSPSNAPPAAQPPQAVAASPEASAREAAKPPTDATSTPPAESDPVAASPPGGESTDSDSGSSAVPLSPEDVLTKHNLKIFGDRAVHADEPKVNELLDAAEKFRKDLRKANGEWGLRQNQLAALTQEITLLRQQYGVVNVRLAQVNANRPLDATTNNVLVGQAGAISTRIELLQQQHKQLTEAADSARKRVAELREGFVQNVLDARQLVDAVQTVYGESVEEVRPALATLAQAAGDEAYLLEPSRTFTRNVRELAALEEQILSDTIEVRDQGGNLYVTVVINGKHTEEMVVDSGASIVLLPHAMAEECGLQPDAAAPDLRLELADGNTITGKAITIPSLRVGRFTAENVEAAVLGPEARTATPLLGMSFLGQFRFEIDNARGLLKLVEVDKQDTPRSR